MAQRRRHGLAGKYPGDFRGTAAVRYAPSPDGAPDPGEIVWTWVPYEEDHTQGKDRPVLLVGRSGPRLLALMLTSKDHSGDHRRSTGTMWTSAPAPGTGRAVPAKRSWTGSCRCPDGYPP